MTTWIGLLLIGAAFADDDTPPAAAASTPDPDEAPAAKAAKSQTEAESQADIARDKAKEANDKATEAQKAAVSADDAVIIANEAAATARDTAGTASHAARSAHEFLEKAEINAKKAHSASDDARRATEAAEGAAKQAEDEARRAAEAQTTATAAKEPADAKEAAANAAKAAGNAAKSAADATQSADKATTAAKAASEASAAANEAANAASDVANTAQESAQTAAKEAEERTNGAAEEAGKAAGEEAGAEAGAHVARDGRTRMKSVAAKVGRVRGEKAGREAGGEAAANEAKDLIPGAVDLAREAGEKAGETAGGKAGAQAAKDAVTALAEGPSWRVRDRIDRHRENIRDALTALDDELNELGLAKNEDTVKTAIDSPNTDAAAIRTRVETLERRYVDLRKRLVQTQKMLVCASSPSVSCYPPLDPETFRAQVGEELKVAEDLRLEADRIASLPRRSLAVYDSQRAAGKEPPDRTAARLEWSTLEPVLYRLGENAREVERLLRALRPAEVDCWSLQEFTADGSDYVIVFDEAKNQIFYPLTATGRARELYAGQEVLLCIAGEDLANRYVVTRGSTSVGENAVLDALSFASTASLHTGVGAIEIPGEEACDVIPTPTDAAALKEIKSCKVILKQARDLELTVEQLATARDSLASRMLGDSSHTLTRAALDPLDAAANPVCVVSDDREDALHLQRRANKPGDAPEPIAVVFDVDGSQACVDRLPAKALLAGETFNWDDGSYVYAITPGGLPAKADGVANEARTVRKSVQDALEKVVAEYDKARALVLNYRKHALRRTVLFNLGSFNENTLLSATLQRNAITFQLDDAGRTLVQQTTATSFAINRTVRDSTYWGVQPGIVVSGLPRREYELVTGSATGATSELRLKSEDIFYAPGLFVNFYPCKQNLTLPLYHRECVGARWQGWRYVPSFAVGVPASADIATGNLFVGLGLPYIPYVTIVTGVHMGQVTTAPDSALSIGTSATSLEDATSLQFGVAPFISINASAEILGLLFPQLKPAN